MTRTLSIAIKENIYRELRKLVGVGKISAFANRAIEKGLGELEKEQKREKEQLRQQLIEGYQKRTKNKELQKTLQVYGEIPNERNEYSLSMVGLPLTTDDLKKFLPVEVYIENTPTTGLDKPSKILCDSPFTWNKGIRFKKRLGVVSKEIIEKVKRT
ncbi:hypothetical protein C1645_841490 [Glomus cerebriforme]|uniref:Uncharacterized protein n=1 Tax=Glomus cerebriforme TaxID=658196 RepID=A0A397RY48_9GLOM|nr:hypothetical protein C1645_841490 [Glomus cerebriforme]